MARKLPEIISHIRAVSGNAAVRTTLIQTEDLDLLCDAAEGHVASSALRDAVVPVAGDPVIVIEFSRSGAFARRHQAPDKVQNIPVEEAMRELDKLAAAGMFDR